MNKELFSENGEFISSRLASKKIGYSHDHISALIRSGKVSGKKVGRVWLVDFHSLENYKKSIDLKNFEPGKISGQMRSYTFKTKNHLGKNFLSVEKASKKIGYSQDHIGALVRGGKVAGQKIGRVWYVDFRSLRRHKKSQRIIFRQNVQKPTTNVPPIEPRLSLPHPISQKVIKYEEEVAPKFVEVSKDKYKIKKELLLRELLGGALITSMLIMVVTLASVSGIKQIAKTDTFNKLADGSISAEISQGLNNTSASILATISDGLQNLWNNLFGKKENTVLVVVPPDSLSNKEPTLKPSTSEGSGKTTIINNPPAQTIINEYKSITQVTPLDLTLDDVVNNGDTTRLDVRLLGNVEIGKNLNIKGSIVSGSSVIAKNGSFSSLSTSGDFSAGGEITLGNPEDNFIINSKNVSIDKDGNTTFLGNFFSANASTTNVYAVNSTSTNSYISLLTGDIATITNFTGTNNTLTNLIYTNATGTNSTTTNLFANSGVITNLNTNNLSLGTTSTSANINIVQTSNGSTTIQANRITDAAPAGDFIRYNNAANDTTLFRVDNSGNLYAGGIINSGSQTITSTSQPQFRVQYDASNENTNSISATGVSTFGFNGSTPRAIFTPQLNATNSFTFTDLSSTPIFNIDTLNQIVSAPHFLSTSSTTLQNFTFINATGTSATTTNLYTTLLVAGSATTTNLFSTNGAFTNLLSSYATTTNLYSSGQTILAGTSGNVGIGTTNPTNALSFGNSQNQKIWVENSTNVIAGRALTLSAGSTVNTGLVDFAPLSQANLNWWSMAAAPSGNVYAAAYNNNLYKQTNGTGNFVAQGLNGGLWGVAVAPNGNVYVAKHNDDIYMQTNETGSFVALGQTPSSWGAMAAAPSGNVYALKVYSGAGLYKQTNGTGDFNLVVSGSWNAVAVAPNGNVYLVGSSDIYMQTNETGSFVALGQGAKSWQSVTVAPNGDVYAVVYGGDVYRQTGGTGNFVALGQISRNWQSMAAAPNGNIYAGVGGGDIYMNVAQGGTADLAGGNLILSAGVGKGTGASNISFLTGTTLTSGTTLQALSEKMTILGNGNVGIGTTSPTYKLSVEGSSTLGNQAIAGYFTATSTTATSTFAGAVGIGTTNPTRAFEIVGNVENNNTGTASQLSIRGTASTIDKLNIGYNTTSNFGFIEAVRESSVTQNLILGPVGGNVGIGITNPNSKLAVNGTIAIAATVSTSIPQTLIWSRQSDNWTPASIGQLYDGSTYGGYLVFNTHTSNLTIGDQATPLERMRIDSSGNVGIGTTSPAYKLSVEGSSTLGNQAIAGYFTATSTTATSTFAGGITGPNNFIVQQVSGNVGIGVNPTSNKLEVTGVTKINGTLTVDGQGTYTIIGQSTGSSPAWFQTKNGSGAFNEFGIVGSNGQFAVTTITDDAVFKFTGSNFVIVGDNQLEKYRFTSLGKFGIGSTSPTYQLSVEGSSTLGNQAIAGYFTATSTTATSTFAGGISGPNNFVVQQGSGNVGIGVTNPQGKLDVSEIPDLGSVYFRSTGRPFIDIKGGANSYKTLRFSDGADGTYKWDVNVLPADDGTLPNGFRISNSGGTALSINSTNYYVGLGGINSPAGVLDVNVGGGQSVYFRSAGRPFVDIKGGASDYKTLRFSEGADSTYLWDVNVEPTNNNMEFWGGGGFRVAFTSGGSVGIGTANPGYMLDVSGSNATSPMIVARNAVNSGDTNWGSLGILNDAAYAVGNNARLMFLAHDSSQVIHPYASLGLEVEGNYMGAITFNTRTVGGATGERMRITNAGNVGIGSTTPAYKLSVEGSSTLGNQAIAGYFTATSTTATSTFSGAVGIGTTSPNAKLAITGTSVSANNKTFVVTDSSNNKLFTILDDGKVAVGARDPFYNKFTINLGVNQNIGFDNDGGVSRIQFRNDVNSGHVPGVFSASSFSFLSGNVGINLPSFSSIPSSQLDVNGNIVRQVDATGVETRIGIHSNDGPITATFGGTLIGTTGVTDGNGNTSNYIAFHTYKSGVRSGEVMRIDENGNIGIGTTSPMANLTINGTTGAISQSGTASGGTLRITEYPNSGAMFLIGTNGGNYGYIQYTNSADKSVGYPLVLNPTAGNVGIGTTTPTGKLHIVSNTIPSLVGSAAAGIIITSQQNSGTELAMGVDLTNSPYPAYLQSRHAGNGTAYPLALNPLGGNVGIGTTNPGTKLDIQGNDTTAYSTSLAVSPSGSDLLRLYNMSNSSNFTAIELGSRNSGAAIGRIVLVDDGGANGDFAFQLRNASGANTVEKMRITTTGNVGIGTTAPFTKLTIKGTTFAEMDLTNGSTALLGNDILGKYSFRSVDADAHVGGDQTLGGMYGIIVHEAGGTGVIDGSADEGMELSFTTSKRPSPNTLFTLTEAMRINKLGNVGIGTTTPGAAFHLYKSNASQPFALFEDIGIDSNPAIQIKNDAQAWNLHTVGARSNNFEIFNATAGGAAANAYLTVTTAGNVGIGTTSPTTKLVVNGGDISVVDVNPSIMLKSSASGEHYGFLQFDHTEGDFLRMFDGTTYSMHWRAGNVGIGTTTPTAALTVKDNNLNKNAIEIQSSAVSPNNYIWGLSAQSNNFFYINQGSNYGTPTTRLTIDNNGNVGIGVTNPGKRLSVGTTGTGDIGVGGSIYIGENSPYAGGGNLYLDATGTGDRDFNLIQYNGASWVTNLFVNGGNGNVGIGTTTPTSHLDVYGSAISQANFNSIFTNLHTGASVVKIEASADTTVNTFYHRLLDLDYSGDASGVTGTYMRMLTGGTERFGIGLSNDEFAITSNAVEVLHITTAGNVGIGTTNPNSLLELKGNGARMAVRDDGVSTDAINFGTDTSGNGIFQMYDTNGVQRVNLYSHQTEGIANYWFTNGNVGIGTTSPGAKLHLTSSVANDTYLFLDAAHATAGTAGGLVQRRARGSISSPSAVSSGDRLGLFVAQGYGSTAYGTAGGMTVIADGTPSGDNIPGRVEFWTSTASLQDQIRMTIKNDGNVGIGTTNPGQQLTVAGSIGFLGVTNGAGTAYLCQTLATGVVSTSTTACNPSSMRFKDNVANINYGLNEVIRMRPTTFDYKPELLVPGHQVGFIAEDMAGIIPEVVGYDSNGLPSNIDYGKLTPVLVRAIQELDLKFDLLNASTTASLSQISLAIQDQSLKIESMQADIANLMNTASTTLATLSTQEQRISDIETLIASSTIFTIATSTATSSIDTNNGFLANIISWLGSMTNGIGDVFASTFNAKDKICVDGECLTKDDIRAMLLVIHPATTTTDTGTTTPTTDVGLTPTTIIDTSTTTPILDTSSTTTPTIDTTTTTVTIDTASTTPVI